MDGICSGLRRTKIVDQNSTDGVNGEFLKSYIGKKEILVQICIMVIFGGSKINIEILNWGGSSSMTDID